MFWTFHMRNWLILVVTLLLCPAAISQTRRATKPIKPPFPRTLTAREIARRTLPSVVLLIGQDANGKAMTLGSGFFVKPSIIATNYHVIEGASRAYAKLNGVETHWDVLGTIGIDEQNDLALVRLEELDPLSEITWRGGRQLSVLSANRAEIGDNIYVIGNPEGLEGTFSQGIISAFRGSDYIQITAPISPGSSGGPVINRYGEVIGIATSFNRKGQNLNFAIPVAKLRPLMRKLSIVTPLRPRIR